MVTHLNTSKPAEIRFCCPFCPARGESVDTRFRLYLNVSNDKAICFNCGYRCSSGAIARLSMELGEDVGFDSAVETVETSESRRDNGPRDFQLLRKADYANDVIAQRATRYAINRGLTREQTYQANAGFATEGLWGYRLIFPLFWKQEVVGWVGRDFSGRERRPKYVMSSDSKQHLFTYGQLKGNTVLVGEGILNVLACQRAVETLGVVATMGSSITDSQVRRLEAIGRVASRVVVWPDADDAGRRFAIELGYLFSECSVVYPSPGDADELEPEVVSKEIVRSQPFCWAMEMKLKS